MHGTPSKHITWWVLGGCGCGCGCDFTEWGGRFAITRHLIITADEHYFGSIANLNASNVVWCLACKPLMMSEMLGMDFKESAFRCVSGCTLTTKNLQVATIRYT